MASNMNKSLILPDAALADESSPEGANTPSERAVEDGLLSRDKQRKTAYYDYATDRSLSQADAKLFYQRQLEVQKTGGSNWNESQQSHAGSPVINAKGYGSVHDGDQGGLGRVGSVKSMKSSGRYRSAFPLGLADMSKDPESTIIQEPSLVQSPISLHREESLLRADLAARDHQTHPDVPHEPKPGLEEQGLHGAGAGVGLGSGAGGFAQNDAHVTSELAAIYTNIQKTLDIRHKYIRLSLQGDGDNPKDEPNWNIYPPPPEPAWYDDRERNATTNGMNSHAGSMSNSMILPDSRPQTRGEHNRTASSQTPMSPVKTKPPKPKRKPGTNIGEDFDIDDVMPTSAPSEMTFKLDENSVFQIYENAEAENAESPSVNIPTLREFYMDLEDILNVSSDGPSKSFAFRRLQYLEGKMNLYVLLNEYQEMADSKRVPHRDFYNVRKVDTHVHHSACMNQKHLLRFIKSKMKKCPDEVVMFRDGKYLTLEEVFQSINLTAYDLSIDTLDMHVSDKSKSQCVARLTGLGTHRFISSFRQVQSQVQPSRRVKTTNNFPENGQLHQRSLFG